jgi:hypothetical protein
VDVIDIGAREEPVDDRFDVAVRDVFLRHQTAA